MLNNNVIFLVLFLKKYKIRLFFPKETWQQQNLDVKSSGLKFQATNIDLTV